jgi:ribosomal protein S18 acetylase RimI-like enzyme
VIKKEFNLLVQGSAHGTTAIRQAFTFHVQSGADTLSDLENKPWNLAEYTVRDLNGSFLRIAGSPTHESGSKPLPLGVTFEIRVPTVEEYLAIQPGPHTAKLEHRLARGYSGCIAFLNDRAVGMARVMQDHEDWLSIWDVEVVPEWSGHHIGQALMRRLLEALAQDHPGAFVHLFTFKDGFYESLGFSTGTCTQVRLPKVTS